MDILFITLAAIGALVALQVFKLFLYVRNLTHVRLKNVEYELREIDDLPAYLQDVFQACGEKLVSLGFALSHCEVVDGPFVSGESKNWQLVYLDAARKTYAILSASSWPSREAPCHVEFLTVFSDDQRLHTVNGISHRIIGKLPDTILLDPYSPSTQEQLATHLKTLSELEKERSPVILPPAEFVGRSKAFLDSYISSLQNSGYVKQLDGTYALRLVPAVRSACRALAGIRKARKLDRQRSKSGEFAVDIPVEAKVASFQRITSQIAKPKQMRWIGKTLLLFGTLLLFALSLGSSMSIEFLAIPVLAVLIHELGHVLGMHVFKYRDLKILFLPFLGAITIGSPEEAKPYQKVIVFFLGPVPGLVLGLICWLLYGYTKSTVARDAAITLFALNYFNLLPIMPLDGGQVLNLVFFARFSQAQFVYQAISLICLTILALFTRAYVLLVISALGFFAIVNSFQKKRFLSKLRKELGEMGAGQALPEREVLFETFKLMREEPLAGYSFAKQCQFAKYAVDNLAIDLPSLKTTVISLSVYTVLLVLPAIVLVTMVFAAIGQPSLRFVLPQPFRPSWPEPVLQQPLGDGDTLAFSHSTGYSADLYLIDDVNGLRPIVQGADFFAGELVWSPDGTRIAYATAGREGYGYHISDADGANQNQIPLGDHYAGWLRWSPDSSRLAGLAYDFSDDAISDAPKFHVVTATTGEMLELPIKADDVEDFVWVADSQSLLAIVWMDDSMAVQVYGVDGSYEKLPVETTHPNDATHLTLSPDASKVAYAIPSEDNEAWALPLYVSTLDGSGVKIVDSLSWDGEIVWSPDSTRIAFVILDDDYNNALCVVNSDGTELRQLMLLDAGDESGEIMPSTFAWSPDGTRIAISSYISADGAAIFVVNADGSERRQITNASGLIYDLAWQPRE